ncbi:MAG: UPF0179 family protein [Thermoproteota archaeon]
MTEKETRVKIPSDIVFLAKGSFKIGERWTYLGNAVECVSCEQERFCHAGLSPGDIFSIIEDKRTNIYCSLRGSELTTVVVKKEIIAALQTRLVEIGITMIYDPIRCDFLECPTLDYCLLGPSSGTMIKIEEILRTFDCRRYVQRYITLARVTPV